MAEMKDRPYEEVDSLVQFYIRMSLEGNPFALGIIAGMVDAGNLELPDDVIKKIQAKLDGLDKGESRYL